ncbi:hypothetical protein ACFLY9_01720 [Patescibacteria group bacterium]
MSNKFFSKKTLHNHWDEIIIVVITATILTTIFIPFFLNNSLDKFDTPGLLSLSWFIKEYRFPDFSGWNPYFFGGFPQGILYPPLFHWLVALIGNFFHLSVAYKLVITAAATFVPFAIYEFSLRIFKQKPWALLNTIVLLITLTLLPGYLGFNFDAVFDYGLGPNFVTIPLFFGYLATLFDKKINVKLLAILFSLMLLTNLVAPLVAGLVTIVWFIIKIIEQRKVFLIIALKFALVVASLTLFWVVPFIVFNKYTASGIPPLKPSLSLTLLLFGGVFTTSSFILWKRSDEKFKVMLSLIVPALIIAILNVLDATVGIVIPPIHPFRLQIFAFLFLAIILVYILKLLHPTLVQTVTKLKLVKFFKRDLHTSFSIFFILFSLFILVIIRLNPSGVDEVKLRKDIDWDGRIMRAYKVTDVLDQSRAVIDRAVMENPDYFAVDGLLKESSYLAPYYQSLSKSINPENFNWDQLDQNYIENHKLFPEKAYLMMNLLWVKSVFTIDESFPDCENFEKISIFTTNTKSEGIVERDMYTCSYMPSKYSNFVEMIAEKPNAINNNWNEELENWWKSDNTELFTTTDLYIPETKVFFVPQVEFSDDFQEIYIYSGIEDELYYIVKMNYFPKWKAYGKDGFEVPIYRISPNFMLVPVKEEVTLRYEMTSFEWIGLVISVLSWTSLIVISGFMRVREMKFYKKIRR